MNDTSNELRLPQPWPKIALAVIVVTALVWMAIGALATAVQWESLSTECAEGMWDECDSGLTDGQVQGFERLGLGPLAVNAALTLSTLPGGIIFLGVAGLILSRRTDSAIGLLTALWFAVLGPQMFAGDLVQVIERYPGLRYPTAFLDAASMALFVPFVFTFPNGRFVPRWSRALVIAVTPVLLLGTSLYGFTPPLSFVSALGLPLTIAMIFLGLVAQIVRYRRHATPRERQQAKWVLLGLAIFAAAISYLIAMIIGMAGLLPLTQALLTLGLAVALPGGFLLIPLTVGLSLVRYRLWDIDVIIRRTLIYSALSAVLAVAYLGSVIVLQGVFQGVTGEGQNALVVVLSTLAIAALFGPVRGRVQATIDKRFFRKKYDAARTLAGFAASARDETDLQHLSARLVAVVDETMQPESVGLWLRPGSRQKSGRGLP
jgi:hypothetical protein